MDCLFVYSFSIISREIFVEIRLSLFRKCYFVSKAKRQLHGFICAKAKRQLHGFICAKAKRQLQLRPSEIDFNS
ncbi:hypothetical protein ABFY48_23265 [Lysinibacillus pakistanensis]|uniref:hypothetical protein n=1 Tax=Lysinibacillus pakistanensis TaxID=759811 RepID=UPI003D2D6AA0